MAHRVDLTPQARRQLRKIPRNEQAHVIASIDGLLVEPRPSGCEKIKGHPGYLRVRTGDYRVIYEIDDDVLRVLVVLIGHRKDIYRLLPGL